ncbi:MAG: AAA family ATPase, partial [Spirosoma sp.]
MLKRISIQNFKSLKDVTLDLQKVNLLIGPNNSGKTNFLKALEYMAKENTNQQEPEYERLLFKHHQSDLIAIELFYTHDKEYNVQTIFSCQVGSNAQIERSKDLIQHGRRSNGTKLHYNPDELKQRLNPLIIYKPDPNKLVQPADFSADEIELKGDCSNLIPFLFYLNTNYKRAYQKIEKDLDRCVQDIISFSTPPVKIGKDSKLGLKFFGKQDEEYWAEDVSEGVLYFLALLTIINQPNPPKLLLLEEPEKGIHPRRIEEVINFIFGLADDKDIQVIMTTHSPAVVDMFKD